MATGSIICFPKSKHTSKKKKKKATVMEMIRSGWQFPGMPFPPPGPPPRPLPPIPVPPSPNPEPGKPEGKGGAE